MKLMTLMTSAPPTAFQKTFNVEAGYEPADQQQHERVDDECEQAEREDVDRQGEHDDERPEVRIDQSQHHGAAVVACQVSNQMPTKAGQRRATQGVDDELGEQIRTRLTSSI